MILNSKPSDKEMTMHTAEQRFSKHITRFVDRIDAGRRRRSRARHVHEAGRLVRTGLEAVALVALARNLAARRNGRAAALLAGAYLTHAGRRRH